MIPHVPVDAVAKDWPRKIANAINALINRTVQKGGTETWAEATGTETRTALAAYAGQTVSNPPTQAEVQAIDDAVKAQGEALAALINDLRDNGALSS